MPWAIVQAHNQPFAIATEDMREMVMMPEVAAIPNTADYIRGVLNLRGRVIPLIDLRKRLGMSSARDETEKFCALMEQREQDHQKWLGELEASVKERRAFTLTTNPHACAFGKWYDAHHADNPILGAALKKFDAPHQKIHAVATEVQKLTAVQDYEKASQLVDRARGGVLAELLKLFADLRNLIRESQREIAVILNVGGKTFSISIDAALSIEKFGAGSVEELPPGASVNQAGAVRRVAKTKTGQVVLILETDLLVKGDEISEGALAGVSGKPNQPAN
jgi:purine-binding chemotaxis protein CheW